METTIKDIAKFAGVSTSTVSRALNNSGRVDEGTRKRILELSERLNYRPSALARGLVMRQTKTVLLLLPNIANAYFAEITKVISRDCRQAGFKILLGDTNEDPEIEADYLNTIRERIVDGAIVASLPGEHNLDQFLSLAQSGFPTVLLDSAMPLLNLSHVVVDNKHGGEIVVDYLYSKGHRKIAFVADNPEVRAFHERLEGFRNGHSKNGIEVRQEYVKVEDEPLERGGMAATDELLALPDPPTAIFAFSDMVAIGCIASVLRHGKRVPEDVAVVGYDDIDISSFIDIPLTTVAQPKEEIARKAVELVVESINNRMQDKEPEVEQHVLKPELVVRLSA